MAIEVAVEGRSVEAEEVLVTVAASEGEVIEEIAVIGKCLKLSVVTAAKIAKCHLSQQVINRFTVAIVLKKWVVEMTEDHLENQGMTVVWTKSTLNWIRFLVS